MKGGLATMPPARMVLPKASLLSDTNTTKAWQEPGASLDSPLTSVPKTSYAVEPRAKALPCDYQDINDNHDGLIAE